MIKSILSLATILTVVASLSLTACGDSKVVEEGPTTPEEYAKEKAKLDKERNDAALAGDNAQLKKLAPECEALEKEIEAKCAEDPGFKAAFDKAYTVELENALAE